MKTGIVMEIDKRKAVVMETGGHFVSVTAKRDWKIGDVVTVPNRNVTYRTLLPMAACLCMVFSLSLFGYRVYYSQAALISIDINPSIELSVNRFDRITSASALNPEAAQILAQTKLKNRTVDDALILLFKRGLDSYVSDSSYLTFTVMADSQKTEDALISQLNTTAGALVSSQGQNPQIECYAVDQETVNAAHSHHLTAGKYRAICELQEVVPQTQVEEFAHCSIGEIKDQIQVHRSCGQPHNLPLESSIPLETAPVETAPSETAPQETQAIDYGSCPGRSRRMQRHHHNMDHR